MWTLSFSLSNPVKKREIFLCLDCRDFAQRCRINLTSIAIALLNFCFLPSIVNLPITTKKKTRGSTGKVQNETKISVNEYKLSQQIRL